MTAAGNALLTLRNDHWQTIKTCPPSGFEAVQFRPAPGAKRRARNAGGRPVTNGRYAGDPSAKSTARAVLAHALRVRSTRRRTPRPEIDRHSLLPQVCDEGRGTHRPIHKIGTGRAAMVSPVARAYRASGPRPVLPLSQKAALSKASLPKAALSEAVLSKAALSEAVL